MLPKKTSKQRFPFIFTLPVLGYFVVMTIFPVIFLVLVSLLDYQFYGTILSAKFIGANNYLVLFGNPQFWNAVRVSLIYITACVGIELILALGLAVAVLRVRLRRGIIFVILMPMVITPAVAAWHWRFMYNDIFGLIPYLIRILTTSSIAPLAEPRWALPALIVMDIWQWTPFVFLILFAGLSSLPHEPYEASVLDGASEWQVFRYVTLPMLKPVITIAVILRTIEAFRTFDKFFIMTEGGPASTTYILSLYNYNMIFFRMKVARGAALSLIMLFITIGMAKFLVSLIKPGFEQEAR